DVVVAHAVTDHVDDVLRCGGADDARDCGGTGQSGGGTGERGGRGDQADGEDGARGGGEDGAGDATERGHVLPFLCPEEVGGAGPWGHSRKLSNDCLCVLKSG